MNQPYLFPVDPQVMGDTGIELKRLTEHLKDLEKERKTLNEAIKETKDAIDRSQGELIDMAITIKEKSKE